MGQVNVCPLNFHLQRRSQRSGVKKITYKPINTLGSIEIICQALLEAKKCPKSI